MQESLKESGRGASGSKRHNRLRNLLIVGEVALSVVLLAGAGLLFRSFLQLQSVNAGFTPQQVLTVRLTPSGPRYARDADYMSFYSQVMQRISELPGVQAVGVINTLPLAKGPTGGFRIEGSSATDTRQVALNKLSQRQFRLLSRDEYSGGPGKGLYRTR